MKLHERTLEILKNFAGINQGILIREGDVLCVSSSLKNLIGYAKVPDTFPREFAIYDLNALLSVISLFSESPDIDFRDDHLLISEKGTKIRFHYSSPAVIVAGPKQEIQFTGEIRSFRLFEADLKQLMKASAVLGLTRLQLESGRVLAKGESDNKHQFDFEVEMASEKAESKKPVIRMENMKLLPGSYDVTIFERAAVFRSVSDPSLSYAISILDESDRG